VSADSATVAPAKARIDQLEGAYGVLMNWFAIVASLLLFAMMLVICGDVLTRNVALPGFRSASRGATRSPS
jgi:hypothetical protein